MLRMAVSPSPPTESNFDGIRSFKGCQQILVSLYVSSSPRREAVSAAAASGWDLEEQKGRAAPLIPTGVIPVDQLCNFTKLEHYRWSSSISDAHRDKDCPPRREREQEGVKRLATIAVAADSRESLQSSSPEDLCMGLHVCSSCACCWMESHIQTKQRIVKKLSSLVEKSCRM